MNSERIFVKATTYFYNVFKLLFSIFHKPIEYVAKLLIFRINT